MRMIDVLNMMTEGKIKDQTILEIYQPIDKLCTYTFNGLKPFIVILDTA